MTGAGMKFHVIYTINAKVLDCEIEASSFGEAEQLFLKEHPLATYYEIGAPLTETGT